MPPSNSNQKVAEDGSASAIEAIIERAEIHLQMPRAGAVIGSVDIAFHCVESGEATLDAHCSDQNHAPHERRYHSRVCGRFKIQRLEPYYMCNVLS